MNQIVYIASPESKQVHVWQMDNQGILVLLQVINIPMQGKTIAIHPNKKNLYVGINIPFGILSYYIDDQGLLTEIGVTLLPGSPTYLSVDLQGVTLYSVSYSSSYLIVSSIDKQGIVGMPIQILKDLNNCHSANINITNQILWVPCLREDRIRLYNIDRFGYLTPSIPEAINTVLSAGPRHMVFHHEGKYAYIINELNGTVNVIALDVLSVPSIVQKLDIMPANFNGTHWAADIHITPDCRWLYCSDRASSLLSIFAVAKDGSRLNLIGHQLTETQPRSFNIDTQGYFLVVAGQKSHYITVYSIEQQTGKLNFLARYAVGKGPMWVSILDR